MQTECPHCHTVFRVTEPELEQSGSQVRCGHCLAVFTASNPYLSVANYKFDDDDTAEESNNTTAEDSPEFIVADIIPPELRAETRQKKTNYSFIGTLLLATAIIVSISAGFLQYAYYNKQELVKIAEFKPWLEKMCAHIGCTLPSPSDKKLISLSSKNIFTHPNTEKALMVTASIINQANFPQDFPIIELRFENIRGRTIAGRRFYAEEYLDIPKDQISQMEPNVPVNINLEIVDPGNDMVSYEFTFL